MTLRELVTTLRDVVLTEHLGTYVHSSNAALNTPAITVGPGSPRGYTVTGLEAAVQRLPEDDPQPLLGDGHRVTREWIVTVKAWDGTANLSEATKAIIRQWPQTPAPTIVPETDESIAQAIVRIPDEQHWPARTG